MVAELEQLALDPLITPSAVLCGEPSDQRGDLCTDWWPACAVRIGPLPGDQAAVPPQDGTGGDQPVPPQPCWQEPDQRGEDCAVGPVEPGPRMGPAQHSEFVPKHQQLRVFDADERPSRTSQPQSRTKIR